MVDGDFNDINFVFADPTLPTVIMGSHVIYYLDEFALLAKLKAGDEVNMIFHELSPFS